jgi:hypothetical protein
LGSIGILRAGVCLRSRHARNVAPVCLSQLSLREGCLPHLETTAKLLKLLDGVFGLFSECTLKSLNNRADFDFAIRRFDPSRPSQRLRAA